MSTEKAVLRKELLLKRKALSPSPLKEENLSSYKEFKDAKTVFCYVSAHGEVDTFSLLEEIIKTKTLLVPYCTDGVGNMIAAKISSLSELKEGRFGILEPVFPTRFDKAKIDVAIVPGIAFDKEGFRLGYGKGYYDRFLKGSCAYKIGVCQKEFLFDALPHDDFDIKMDSVVVL